MENSNRSQSAADDAEPSQYSQGDVDAGQEVPVQSNENNKEMDSDEGQADSLFDRHDQQAMADAEQPSQQ